MIFRHAALRVGLAVAAAMIAGHQLSAYVLNGGKWNAQQVSYYVNASTPDMPAAEALAAVQAAADAWTLQSDASIRLQYAGATSTTTNGYDGVNTVQFRNASNGSAIASTYYWYNSSTGEMVDFDVIFWDAGFQFFTGIGTCSNGFYVEDVGTHEFGHALGLGHSPVSTATMVSGQSTCTDTKRSLDPDDIAGIETLYPSSAATKAPAAPSALTVTGTTTGSVSLAWADNSTNEDTFLVERSTDGGVNWLQVTSTGPNATTYTNSGLAPDTTYAYRVRASNSGGFSGYAGPVSATTAAAVTTAPSIPSNPSPANGATGVSTRVTLSWSSTGATSYVVYLGVSGSQLSPVATVSSASYTPGTLLAATSYSWKVAATNTAGTVEGPDWTFTTKAATKRKR